MATQLQQAPLPAPDPSGGPGGSLRPKNAPKSLFDPQIMRRASIDSFRKLDPRLVAKNPVMFVVEVGSVITTYYFFKQLLGHGTDVWFVGQVAVWLWFTVLFANFAEAMAEGRGKAQADTLRKAKSDSVARRLLDGGKGEESVPGTALRKRLVSFWRRTTISRRRSISVAICACCVGFSPAATGAGEVSARPMPSANPASPVRAAITPASRVIVAMIGCMSAASPVSM